MVNNTHEQNVWKKREPVCQIAELKIDWSNNEFKAQIKCNAIIKFIRLSVVRNTEIPIDLFFKKPGI